MILGLGAGWHEPEFSAFGYPFDHLASRFEDALRIVAPLVRGDAVDYRERMNGLSTASPARGTATGWSTDPGRSLAAQDAAVDRGLADAWNNAGWPGRLSWRRDLRLHAACSDGGRDPTTLDVTVGQIVAIPQTTQDDGESDSSGRFAFTSAEDLADEATIRARGSPISSSGRSRLTTNVCNS